MKKIDPMLSQLCAAPNLQAVFVVFGLLILPHPVLKFKIGAESEGLI